MENLVTLHPYSNAYKGKKVFITGHTGFKGTWLSVWLRQLGAIIKGYSLAPESNQALFCSIPTSYFVESTIADIRNKACLQEAILSFQPDYIFHLAAQPLVKKSYNEPSVTFDTNVIGTANLLEVCTLLPNKCTIIVITTDKVYENKEKDILYREDDTLGGYDPYSASKACTELVVTSFRNSFFHPSKTENHLKKIVSVRAGNVIGGGDWSADRIIPDIIRALKSGQPIQVRNPQSIRPWQHVLEPLSGYLLLGSLLHSSTKTDNLSPAYNFGPNPKDHLTVETVVNAAIDMYGNGSWINTNNPQQPHEANLLKLDIAKAQNELKWTPKLTAKQAIEWTIDWYKIPAANQLRITLAQIEAYQQL